MRPKKILIFSFAFFPLIGGAEVAVREITDRVRPDDIRFDMITARLDKKSKKRERIGNINVWRIRVPRFLFPFSAFLKAVRLHRENNYDFVWSIMAAYAGFAGLFFKAAFRSVPFLLTLQEGDPESHILKRVGFLYPLWKKIFQNADFIQTISNYLADFAKRHGASCPIEVIPNGVDFTRFSQAISSDERERLRRELDFSSEDVVLVTASRLVKKNAVEDVVKALKYLPENVKFLVLGAGLMERDIKSQIANLKLKGRVKMLGEVAHSELPKYLALANVFIRPSLSEGMGNSFIEAMAAGIPVIGTPVGGIIDFLKDGETGFFCNVRDPESIAEKVKTLLEDDELRQKIVLNAKKMVAGKYDWDKIAKDMERIFYRLFKKDRQNLC